eukprot:TRINITY_DN4080_c0_g5_i1.p8 TRINITY_DN4080_c0_g5~~TRINITY_DN4080_c0_g5_i1.p8  ORF type:complete len:108 (+),score=0.77 TRINITY_DN4080_c0_g5_i1:1495-1818(+)
MSSYNRVFLNEKYGGVKPVALEKEGHKGYFRQHLTKMEATSWGQLLNLQSQEKSGFFQNVLLTLELSHKHSYQMRALEALQNLQCGQNGSKRGRAQLLFLSILYLLV